MPDPPGRLKYNFMRYGLRLLIACYLRVRVQGAALLPPDSSYVVCFSHPNWIDPLLIVGHWPDRRWLYIFGPREADMAVGWRNRLIIWGRVGVPFKPSRDDLLDTTRRAVGVLRRGHALAIAGEGRLSDREGEILPLQDGPAFFALRAGVPIVPLAVIGTRWLRFGKRVRLRIGAPLATDGLRADRETVARLTKDAQAALETLLVGVTDEPPPGPFGRWLTELFNERPWLAEAVPASDEREGAKPG
ncbi:MAG: 1-acyl-sn-glycerol-3-phosphate acyltransferase [Chloroflexota bacterium]|nr:1-acyl-sn-glycerol-3-phosphate acyltransferase [Chloroflexota bacterium]